MKLISVNVGLPREVMWGGKAVRSSIWKNPVQGRIHVSTLNLDGDQQSDLSVHGGVDKAVYVYPSEHLLILANSVTRCQPALGGRPAKIYPLKVFSRTMCKSAIAFVLARPSSW